MAILLAILKGEPRPQRFARANQPRLRPEKPEEDPLYYMEASKGARRMAVLKDLEERQAAIEELCAREEDAQLPPSPPASDLDSNQRLLTISALARMVEQDGAAAEQAA